MSESNFIRHFGIDLGFDGDGRSDGTGIGSVPNPTPDVTPDNSVKKHRNTRSLIWQHFTIQEKDPNRANCNYCGADLGCKSSSAEIAAVSYLLGEWSEHVICGDDEIFKSMALKMKDKYEKYWGDPEKMNKYIFIDVILDPRTKESHFFKDLVQDTYGSTKGNAILTATHNEFVSLFGEYKQLYGSSSTSSELTSQSETSQNALENSLMRERYNKRMRLNNLDGSANSKTELDKYHAEDPEEQSSDFDILSWWKCHSARFPILSKLARDILAIPISTVASKSAFSTSGRILDDFRSSLTPMTLQALICAQDWLHRKRINIEADLAELTKLEEEFGGLQVDDDEIISID